MDRSTPESPRKSHRTDVRSVFRKRRLTALAALIVLVIGLVLIKAVQSTGAPSAAIVVIP